MNLAGYEFEGPFYHTRKFDTDFGAVYVLINNNNQVVDVGETSNINERIINHPRKTCWIQHGCPETGLYLYISNDENFRLLLERLIRIQYNPLCGDR